MGMSNRLESTLSQDIYYIELYICFILWRLVILLTQNSTVRSLNQNMTLTSPSIMNIDDNMRKKTENIDHDEHKQTCPKRKAAIKAQKLIYQWMNT